ncbi:MAG: sulfite exporter TauE/SafE family protein [Phycisphaerales bacterium]|nr:MAG: sulfite exporter TauE/SafE family protein [Phycisphaerales bacterium]
MAGGELAVLALIGLFAGLIGGLLGIGGSIIMIPAMTEVLGPDQHLYQAAAMIVNFFVVVPAVIQHVRARAIAWGTVARLLPIGAAAVIGGVAISELRFFAGSGEAYLRGLFGLFLLLISVSDLYRLFRSEPAASCEESVRRPGWRFAAAIAVPAGLVAGLLGVGGGILAVPLQRRFLAVPIRQAIANSAALIIATSLIGATCKNYAYVVHHEGSLRSFGLAAVLIPTAAVGSWIGSRLTHTLPRRTVRTAFLIVLLVAAVRLIYHAALAVPK